MEGEYKNKVHKLLAQSYALFLLFFLAGMFLDISFPVEISRTSILISAAGLILILFASFLMFWAQKSNRKLDKQNLSKETFSKGPYRYIKHHTQFGLVLLLLGFGAIADTAYLLILAALYAAFAFFFFFKQQDKILEAKYGEHYKEYERSVRLKF